MGGAPASDLPPAGSGERRDDGDELVRGTCHCADLHDGGGGVGVLHSLIKETPAVLRNIPTRPRVNGRTASGSFGF